jgi:ribokinase
MPKTFDIISVGSALRDVTYYTNAFSVIKNPVKDPTRQKLLAIEYGAKVRSDNVHFDFGGGASNTAVASARLGMKTGIITSVGNDLDGRVIATHLRDQGVDVSLLHTHPKKRTGLSFVAVDERTGEHTAFVYYGATEDVRVTPAMLRNVRTQCFYVSSLNGPQWKSTMRTLFATGTRVAWNPGAAQLSEGFKALHPFFALTDLLILNRDEAMECILSEGEIKPKTIPQMLTHIQSWGPKIVVITNSRKGAHAYCNGKLYFVPAPKDTPVDTTGAGDSYGSSLVVGLLRYNGDIKRSMQLATVNATANVKVVGAQRGLMRWSELPKRLRAGVR